MTPRSPTAPLSRTTGWVRASFTAKEVPEATTCWQKEWVSRVPRREAQGSGKPTRLKYLPVSIDERHEGDRNPQQATDQSDQPIEGLLGRTVEQVGTAQRFK